MQELWCSQNQPTSGIKTQTLTHFFPMFPFDAPENITFGFLMFSGGSKENIGKKWVNKRYLS